MSTESTDPRSLLLWIDDVCDQFENDWKLGRAPSLRHILNGLKASPAERPRFFKELFLLELELRSDAGETIDEAIYTAEFPEFRDLIETSLREFRTKSFKESPPPQEFADFETNLRYKLIEPLAEGGLGRIYRVLETTIGRELAMKEIKRAVDNPNTRARFDREARLTGKLDHPGISPVFGIGSHRDGRPLYVMRLIRGESLRDVIRALHGDGEGPGAMTLGLRTLLGKFVSVCDIIAYAHSKNIVHRDLKPSNVMLGPYGEVLVVDWGLAKEVSAKNIGNYETSSDPEGTTSGTASFPGDSFQTVPGRAVGTPQFMSPEQALAKIDEIGPLSDIYSLGATLYDLLTGRPPFSESNQSDIVLRRVVIGDFLSPRKVRPGLPRALEAVCLKAMALKPEDRYPNAEALAEDLRRWLADEPVSARPEPLLEKTRRWVIKRKVAVSGIAGALLLALCLGVPLVVRNRIAKQEDLTRAQTIVSLILSANDESLTGLIDGLQGNRGVLTELATRYRDTRLDDDGKLKAALAIGPGQIEIRAYLEEGLFDAPLSLLPLISERLKTNHSATLLNRLRSTMANERESSARRFRASIALARLGETHAPGDEALWKASAPMVVNSLIESISLDPSIIGKLVRSFDPVQHDLFPALAEEYRDTPVPPSDPAKATRRTIVMAILDEFKQTTRELAELLKDTFVGPRLVKYLAQIKSLGPPAVQAIQEELERPIALDIEENPENAADTEATRRSRLAVALFGAGRRDLVWSYFGDKEHPGFREEFIRRLPRLSAEVRAAILERLPLEKEPAIRRGMIESLASFSAESVAEEIPRPTRVWLLEQYRNDPDPGVHGSIGWFLRNVLNESAAVNRHGIEALQPGTGVRLVHRSIRPNALDHSPRRPGHARITRYRARSGSHRGSSQDTDRPDVRDRRRGGHPQVVSPSRQGDPRNVASDPGDRGSRPLEKRGGPGGRGELARRRRILQLAQQAERYRPIRMVLHRPRRRSRPARP